MEMDSIYNVLQNPSEDVYSTVNQPQGKRAGAQQGDPTLPVSAAGKASSYRRPALVLLILCCLLLAAIISLAVYHLKSPKEDQEKYIVQLRNVSLFYGQLETNNHNLTSQYSRLNETHSELQSNCSRLNTSLSECKQENEKLSLKSSILHKYCPLPLNGELFLCSLHFY
ncbi:C-type lectin domain family 4 member F-like [Huso huso]|uniref:C-type lectin domain family 4 member F-like n=1 Tax=Huso huso TaxID=61971 RepID=A0ABR0YY92_HUSHU